MAVCNSVLDKIIKKIIVVGGGYYLDEIHSELTTHIITDSVSELSKIEKLIVSDIYIVNILWIKECTIFKRKINENEYRFLP